MYINGDKVEQTGNTTRMYGGFFYQYKFIEGHQEGETTWSQRKPTESLRAYYERMKPEQYLSTDK